MFCENVWQKVARDDKKVTDQVRGQRGVTLPMIRLRVVQFEEKVHLYSVHSVHSVQESGSHDGRQAWLVLCSVRLSRHLVTS